MASGLPGPPRSPPETRSRCSRRSPAAPASAPSPSEAYCLDLMRFHRVLLIVNPVARTYSRPVLAVIEKALSADFRLEVSETKGRGHARELAAQAASEGVHMVAVLSGDGTINETV